MEGIFPEDAGNLVHCSMWHQVKGGEHILKVDEQYHGEDSQPTSAESLRYPKEGEEEGPTHDHEVDDWRHSLGTRLVVE